MVYVIAVAGFVGGFIVGLVALQYILKDRSKTDLINDKSLRIYGLVTWGAAVLGAVSSVALWSHFVG